MRPERYYKQTITYWSPGTEDGFGSPAFGTPVSFLGRWENKSETILGNKGEVIRSEASVYYPQDLNLLQDGYVCIGDQTDTLDPRQASGAAKIMLIAEVPDLRNIHVLQIAML